jgi:hypothetical protein
MMKTLPQQASEVGERFHPENLKGRSKQVVKADPAANFIASRLRKR